MTTKTVVWLDDKIESIVEHISFCEKLRIKVKVCTTLLSFKEHLERPQPESGDILIAVDLGLTGVKNLAMLGLPHVITSLGDDVGWLVVEHFLRPEKRDAPYAGMPVLVVTVQPVTSIDRRRVGKLNHRARRLGHPIIKIVQKEGLSLSGRGTAWEEFKDIITGWVKGEPWDGGEDGKVS